MNAHPKEIELYRSANVGVIITNLGEDYWLMWGGYADAAGNVSLIGIRPLAISVTDNPPAEFMERRRGEYLFEELPKGEGTSSSCYAFMAPGHPFLSVQDLGQIILQFFNEGLPDLIEELEGQQKNYYPNGEN